MSHRFGSIDTPDGEADHRDQVQETAEIMVAGARIASVARHAQDWGCDVGGQGEDGLVASVWDFSGGQGEREGAGTHQRCDCAVDLVLASRDDVQRYCH